MQRIGLIAGNGQLPIMWAKSACKNGAEVIAFAFYGETDKSLQNQVKKIYWFKLGELSKFIKTIKAEKVDKAIMIGQIRPVHFLFRSFFSKDEELRSLLNQVKDKRGNSLLAAFANRIEKEGIELLDSRTFIQDYLPQAGNLTRINVDEKIKKDIEFGLKIAREMAMLDIGQTVVVKDLTVLAVEAIEGTNKAILRGAELGGRGVVVIKTASPKHDMRFDIPVFGPKTIYYLRKVKAKALAIEAQRTIIIDKEKTLNLAEKNNIVVIAVE
ncbi:MAG: UDP-2,3-diacylglucosamine diphosphatase LpxI [Candidatus Omnitrophota bacterium]